ncbi:unnamed protein product [Calypogeia fissa]
MRETRLLFRSIGELACSVFASVVSACNIALLLIEDGFALSSHVVAPTRNIALLSIPTKEEEDLLHLSIITVNLRISKYHPREVRVWCAEDSHACTPALPFITCARQ